uniref:Uncharacterized protein n=1 Tax=Steinernema glaseri TaxID=37863 RepID=A0A1I8AI60_9BILA
MKQIKASSQSEISTRGAYTCLSKRRVLNTKARGPENTGEGTVPRRVYFAMSAFETRHRLLDTSLSKPERLKTKMVAQRRRVEIDETQTVRVCFKTSPLKQTRHQSVVDISFRHPRDETRSRETSLGQRRQRSRRHQVRL